MIEYPICTIYFICCFILNEKKNIGFMSADKFYKKTEENESNKILEQMSLVE